MAKYYEYLGLEYKEKVEYTIGGIPITYLVRTTREPLPPDVKCKFCGSRQLVRYGKYNNVQRYMCRDCHRKGADNESLPGMRNSPKVIGAALAMFYEGSSFDSIRRHLWQIFHVQPSKSTLYEWVVKYSRVAEKLIANLKPNVSNVWVVDETVLRVGGINAWFWDIIDSETRFLIASHLSITRTTRDAQTVMRYAQRKTNKSPKFIISDKLAAYLDGIERVFGADTWHLQSQGFRGEINTNLVERFHGTLKSRTKVMRGMSNRETAKLVLSGWLIHYNFFRPHESLGGKTPAQAAGIKFPYSDWSEIVGGKKLW